MNDCPECYPWDEDCPNFNPEENGTPPTDPHNAPSYQENQWTPGSTQT